MHSISFDNIPEYIQYIPWLLVTIVSIIGLKRNSSLKKKEQKEGCGKLLFSIIFIWSSSYFFFPLLISLIQVFYAITFYPKYEAVIVDSVSKYHGTSNGRKQYLSHPIYEISIDNNKIRVESNEATKVENIILGSKTKISYNGKNMINNSNWSLVSYFSSLLIAIFMGHLLLFSIFYSFNKDLNYIKSNSILVGLYFYIPYLVIILIVILYLFFI